MSLARRVFRPVASAVAVWVGKRLMRGVQKRAAKSVTTKGGRIGSRRGLTGILLAAVSAAALAGLKMGVDRAFSDRKERHNSEFDVFDDDEH